MLIKFNIDIDAVIADIESHPDMVGIWLTELWDFWQPHGILCGGKTDDFWDKASRLLDTTQAHKAPVKTIIDALIDTNVELNRRMVEDVDVNFLDVKDCSNLVEFGVRSNLTLMGSAQITAMKNDQEAFCVHCSDTEVVPWQYARNACVLEAFTKDFVIPRDWGDTRQ